ncbi:MAG: sensor histidine kinase [Myxococcota bacterium]
MHRLDRWLAVVFTLDAAVEVLLRDDLPSRTFAFAFGAFIATTLAFRTARPLLATTLAFSAATASSVLEIVWDLPPLGPYAAACILLLPWSLTRWGTRRQVLVGAGFIAAAWVSSLFTREVARPADAIGGLVVLLFPGALGAVMRYRDEAHARALDQARLREREQLARELHDSVAHHVAAITVQAQAAGAVLKRNPEAAQQALGAIEAEAKHTLTELRALVGTLRDATGAPLAPERRIADLAALAQRSLPPLVEVELTGNLDGLPPAVERAVFRLGQESITNALKHARAATRISLRVAGDEDGVLLTAQDDGAAAGAPGAGFGLVGMAERAALLGGTFAAGPAAAGGWRVEARVPRAPKGSP